MSIAKVIHAKMNRRGHGASIAQYTPDAEKEYAPLRARVALLEGLTRETINRLERLVPALYVNEMEMTGKKIQDYADKLKKALSNLV